jgi:hypothetical protein
MPFTFAHPAAAVPLLRPLGRFGSLSALVIGSMTPDFWYLFPYSVGRGGGHSFSGLFWFCLPMGVVVYLLFHALVKQPVLSVLPTWVAARLSVHAHGPALSPGAWPAALLSLFVGAVTHVAWDAFTHSDGPGVAALPFLETLLFSVHGYHLHVYKLLQHTSTFAGLALLARWSWRWLRVAPIQTLRSALVVSPAQRGVLLATLVTLPALGALSVAAPLFHSVDLWTIQVFFKRAVLIGMAVLGGELLLFGACWQVGAWFAHRPVAPPLTPVE